jgi:hypothetical protein
MYRQRAPGRRFREIPVEDVEYDRQAELEYLIRFSY